MSDQGARAGETRKHPIARTSGFIPVAMLTIYDHHGGIHVTKRRPVALGAAITIGFGSLFFAAPALADDVETPTDQQVQEAPVVAEDTTAVPEEAPVAAAEVLENAGVEVVALGVDASGNPVIVQTEGSETGPEVDAAIDAYAAELGSPGAKVQTVSEVPTAYAATDVVGGAGYLAYQGGTAKSFCSVGFTAWSPDNEPVLLSAGHCTHDSDYTETGLVQPSEQPAVTGGASGSGAVPNGTGKLGDFGFSQFGGVGNSEATDANNPDPEGTDVSIIENIPSTFDLRPEVTDWTSADDDDLAASTIKIKSANTANPVPGSAVSKSGRTTGYTSGTVGNLVDGWATITTPEGEPRWVRGFESNVLAAPGDSGGAVFQGTNAIGVISGGSPASGNTPQFTWTASLKHILPHIPGYEVALDIDAPSVDTDLSEKIAGGSDIVVSVPSNATELSVGFGNAGETVPVSNGKATFKAPTTPDDYSYTIVAQNGKSSSDSVTVDFSVALAAPAIDTTKFTSNDVTITGTGVADATVDLFLRNADGIGEAHSTTVESDGTWSVDAELGYGTFDYELRQSLNGEDSSVVEGEIKVLPAAPGDPTIANGSEFPVGEGPTSLSGTGINDANVSLEFTEGTQPAGISNSTQVADGEWGFDFGAPLPSGSYTLTITQSVTNPEVAIPVNAPVAFLVGASEEVVTSDPTVITFVVAAAVDPGANAGGAADGGSAAGGGADGTAAAGGGTAGAGANGTAGAGAGANGTAGAGASGTAGAGTGADGAKLVNTGFNAGSLVPFGIAALGMLVLGAGAIVLTQRRLRAADSE